MDNQHDRQIDTITLGGGCFWCTEAVFQQVRGVLAVENGYSNGNGQPVSYEQVCSGDTGYVEVVQLRFDPAVVSLPTLLDIFFAVHDPTSLNRQGADVGTQYRSGIYCQDELQREDVQAWVDSMRPLFERPVVTEVLLRQHYQRAEDYHQNYFVQHPHQGYCAMVVAPKVDKFRSVFADWQR